jgi:hypothetical protein
MLRLVEKGCPWRHADDVILPHIVLHRWMQAAPLTRRGVARLLHGAGGGRGGGNVVVGDPDGVHRDDGGVTSSNDAIDGDRSDATWVPPGGMPSRVSVQVVGLTTTVSVPGVGGPMMHPGSDVHHHHHHHHYHHPRPRPRGLHATNHNRWEREGKGRGELLVLSYSQPSLTPSLTSTSIHLISLTSTSICIYIYIYNLAYPYL